MDDSEIRRLKSIVKPGDKLCILVGNDYIRYEGRVGSKPYYESITIICDGTNKKEFIKLSDITGLCCKI